MTSSEASSPATEKVITDAVSALSKLSVAALGVYAVWLLTYGDAVELLKRNSAARNLYAWLLLQDFAAKLPRLGDQYAELDSATHEWTGMRLSQNRKGT